MKIFRGFIKRITVYPLILVLSNVECILWVFINDRFNYKAMPWMNDLAKWVKK